MTAKPILSRPIEVTSVREDGVLEHIEATAGEREAIRKDHGLVAVDSVSADLTLKRRGDAILVDGHITAEVVHSCVVSLAPVRQSIDEPLHASFVNAGSAEAPPPPRPGAEIMVDPIMASWDAGPFPMIVSEAGGRFTSITGEFTMHGKSGISTNGRLHDEVLKELATP